MCDLLKGNILSLKAFSVIILLYLFEFLPLWEHILYCPSTPDASPYIRTLFPQRASSKIRSIPFSNTVALLTRWTKWAFGIGFVPPYFCLTTDSKSSKYLMTYHVPGTARPLCVLSQGVLKYL